MRKFFTSVLMLSALVSMADTPKYLTLHAGGKAESYAISGIRKITFGSHTANTLEIHKKGSSTIDSYAYTTIQKGVFEVIPSGVEGVLADNCDLAIVYNAGSQEITITSSHEIAHVAVFNLNGIMVESFSPMTTEAVISMADYEQGLYVVKAMTASATTTQKILKH